MDKPANINLNITTQTNEKYLLPSYSIFPVNTSNYKIIISNMEPTIPNLDIFKCLLCMHIANNPVSCQNCNYLICEKCLQDSKNNKNQINCTNCNSIFFGKNLNYRTQNNLNNLKIKCPKNSCTSIFPYIELKQHLEYCFFNDRMSECCFCKVVILTKNDHREIKEHLKTCLLAYIQCEFCDLYFLRNSFQEHKKICLKKININNLNENKTKCEICKELLSIGSHSIRNIPHICSFKKKNLDVFTTPSTARENIGNYNRLIGAYESNSFFFSKNNLTNVSNNNYLNSFTANTLYGCGEINKNYNNLKLNSENNNQLNSLRNIPISENKNYYNLSNLNYSNNENNTDLAFRNNPCDYSEQKSRLGQDYLQSMENLHKNNQFDIKNIIKYNELEISQIKTDYEKKINAIINNNIDENQKMIRSYYNEDHPLTITDLQVDYPKNINFFCNSNGMDLNMEKDCDFSFVEYSYFKNELEKINEKKFDVYKKKIYTQNDKIKEYNVSNNSDLYEFSDLKNSEDININNSYIQQISTDKKNISFEKNSPIKLNKNLFIEKKTKLNKKLIYSQEDFDIIQNKHKIEIEKTELQYKQGLETIQLTNIKQLNNLIIQNQENFNQNNLELYFKEILSEYLNSIKKKEENLFLLSEFAEKFQSLFHENILQRQTYEKYLDQKLNDFDIYKLKTEEKLSKITIDNQMEIVKLIENNESTILNIKTNYENLINLIRLEKDNEIKRLIRKTERDFTLYKSKQVGNIENLKKDFKKQIEIITKNFDVKINHSKDSFENIIKDLKQENFDLENSNKKILQEISENIKNYLLNLFNNIYKIELKNNLDENLEIKNKIILFIEKENSNFVENFLKKKENKNSEKIDNLKSSNDIDGAAYKKKSDNQIYKIVESYENRLQKQKRNFESILQGVNETQNLNDLKNNNLSLLTEKINIGNNNKENINIIVSDSTEKKNLIDINTKYDKLKKIFLKNFLFLENFYMMYSKKLSVIFSKIEIELNKLKTKQYIDNGEIENDKQEKIKILKQEIERELILIRDFHVESDDIFNKFKKPMNNQDYYTQNNNSENKMFDVELILYYFHTEKICEEKFSFETLINKQKKSLLFLKEKYKILKNEINSENIKLDDNRCINDKMMNINFNLFGLLENNTLGNEIEKKLGKDFYIQINKELNFFISEKIKERKISYEKKISEISKNSEKEKDNFILNFLDDKNKKIIKFEKNINNKIDKAQKIYLENLSKKNKINDNISKDKNFSQENKKFKDFELENILKKTLQEKKLIQENYVQKIEVLTQEKTNLENTINNLNNITLSKDAEFTKLQESNNKELNNKISQIENLTEEKNTFITQINNLNKQKICYEEKIQENNEKKILEIKIFYENEIKKLQINNDIYLQNLSITYENNLQEKINNYENLLSLKINEFNDYIKSSDIQSLDIKKKHEKEIIELMDENKISKENIILKFQENTEVLKNEFIYKFENFHKEKNEEIKNIFSDQDKIISEIKNSYENKIDFITKEKDSVKSQNEIDIININSSYSEKLENIQKENLISIEKLKFFYEDEIKKLKYFYENKISSIELDKKNEYEHILNKHESEIRSYKSQHQIEFDRISLSKQNDIKEIIDQNFLYLSAVKNDYENKINKIENEKISEIENLNEEIILIKSSYEKKIETNKRENKNVIENIILKFQEELSKVNLINEEKMKNIHNEKDNLSNMLINQINELKIIKNNDDFIMKENIEKKLEVELEKIKRFHLDEINKNKLDSLKKEDLILQEKNSEIEKLKVLNEDKNKIILQCEEKIKNLLSNYNLYATTKNSINVNDKILEKKINYCELNFQQLSKFKDLISNKIKFFYEMEFCKIKEIYSREIKKIEAEKKISLENLKLHNQILISNINLKHKEEVDSLLKINEENKIYYNSQEKNLLGFLKSKYNFSYDICETPSLISLAYNIIKDIEKSNPKKNLIGYGISFYENGEIYEGEIDSNFEHGYGILYKLKLQKIYEGFYENGKKTGKGLYIISQSQIYEGDFKNDFFHGKGTFIENGEIYKGDFIESTRTGTGKIYYTNGEKYEGNFKDNLRYGQGVLSKPNGETYHGNWLNDLRFGNGTLFYPNGCKLTGMFNDEMDNFEGKFYSNVENKNEFVFCKIKFQKLSEKSGKMIDKEIQIPRNNQVLQVEFNGDIFDIFVELHD